MSFMFVMFSKVRLFVHCHAHTVVVIFIHIILISSTEYVFFFLSYNPNAVFIHTVYAVIFTVHIHSMTHPHPVFTTIIHHPPPFPHSDPHLVPALRAHRVLTFIFLHPPQPRTHTTFFLYVHTGLHHPPSITHPIHPPIYCP